MKSVIINMADRMKDAADLKLESLFASTSVADAGFSARIEKRIRRRQWVSRLALPIAMLVGGLIAVKPLAAAFTLLSRFAAILPRDLGGNLASLSASGLPQLSTVILGGMLALAFVMISRMLED